MDHAIESFLATAQRIVYATLATVGYDPVSIWPGGPDADGFAAIRLDPWRVQTRTAAATAAGEPYVVWQDG